MKKQTSSKDEYSDKREQLFQASRQHAVMHNPQNIKRMTEKLKEVKT